MRTAVIFVVMLADQQGEHCGQQHENQGLNETNQQFQKVKWDGNQPAQAWNDHEHGFQDVFTGKHIAVETKAECNGAEEDGDHFENADGKEDKNHEHFHETGSSAFVAENMINETSNTI